MKKFLSISFAILLFIGGLFCNDMEEVYKIPSLISHYFDHREKEAGDFDFIDYLVLHYGTDHGNDAENSNLPFFQHSIPAMTFELSSPLTFSLIVIPEKKDHLSFYKFSSYEEIIHSHLQPPKIS